MFCLTIYNNKFYKGTSNVKDNHATFIMKVLLLLMLEGRYQTKRLWVSVNQEHLNWLKQN